MAKYTDPNFGVVLQWPLDESGWDIEMNANLRKLGSTAFLSIIDRDLSTPPGSPVNGDRYLVGAAATGAWAGQEGDVTVYLSGDVTPGWFFFTPKNGWRMLIDDEGLLVFYDGTGWRPEFGSTVALSAYNMVADADYTLLKVRSSYPVVEITDTGVVLTTGRNIIMPTEGNRLWTVVNSTAQILTFKTSAGTGIAVGIGATAMIRGDGTDILRVTADV